MIRIALILGVVLACFNMPTYFDGIYTNLDNLRENSYRSLILGCAAVYFCRSFVGYGIAGVEWLLLTFNLYIAYSWHVAPALYLAQHYESLQLGAYLIELMLIAVGIILEARGSGADLYDVDDWSLPSWADNTNRGLRP